MISINSLTMVRIDNKAIMDSEKLRSGVSLEEVLKSNNEISG